MHHEALLDQARLDARGLVMRHVLGKPAENRVEKRHERELDAPVRPGEVAQTAFDQPIERRAIGAAAQSLEMAADGGQKARVDDSGLALRQDSVPDLDSNRH
jgi:hypothetical protein